MDDPDLAAALASRICHDLVSPVGAVVNGVDLLRESRPADIPDTVAMVAQSAGRASALLQFYRVAFGAADGDGKPIGRPALRELAAVLAQPPRVTISWGEESGPAFTRPEARLISLLVLSARSVLGLRGTIQITPARDTAFPLIGIIQSTSFSQLESMCDFISGARADLFVTPRSVEFALVRQALECVGAETYVEHSQNTVRISVKMVGRCSAAFEEKK